MSGLRTAVLGAGAGAVAGIVQPAAGKLVEKLFFPADEDANIPRHLVEATERRMGMRMSDGANQLAGVAFHVGYSLFWGAAYAAVRERWSVSPEVGGVALGAVLYGAAFSRVSAGVQLGSEQHPSERSRRGWLLTGAMPLVYGLTTAWVYEQLRRV